MENALIRDNTEEELELSKKIEQAKAELATELTVHKR
jgi:hypothetical protein